MMSYGSIFFVTRGDAPAFIVGDDFIPPDVSILVMERAGLDFESVVEQGRFVQVDRATFEGMVNPAHLANPAYDFTRFDVVWDDGGGGVDAIHSTLDAAALQRLLPALGDIAAELEAHLDAEDVAPTEFEPTRKELDEVAVWVARTQEASKEAEHYWRERMEREAIAKMPRTWRLFGDMVVGEANRIDRRRKRRTARLQLLWATRNLRRGRGNASRGPLFIRRA